MVTSEKCLNNPTLNLAVYLLEYELYGDLLTYAFGRC